MRLREFGQDIKLLINYLTPKAPDCRARPTRGSIGCLVPSGICAGHKKPNKVELTASNALNIFRQPEETNHRPCSHGWSDGCTFQTDYRAGG